MNKITHPIEPEELMAYVDGELSADREAVATAHLKECGECQDAIVGLQAVTQSLKAWKVGPADSQIPHTLEVALTEYKSKANAAIARRSWGRRLFRPRLNLAWAGGAAAALLILIGTVRFIGGNANGVFSDELSAPKTDTEPRPSNSQPDQIGRLQQFSRSGSPPAAVYGVVPADSTPQSELMAKLESGQESRENGAHFDEKTPASAVRRPEGTVPSSAGPMIIRTAQLTLITKAFDKVREDVESILKRHRGYIGELKVGGSSGSGRTLTGTLRVPADQLDLTIVDLKPLGRLDSESQTGQDVASQYVDLQARLANARSTEQRLTDILQNRTGKLSDVLEVEQEIDRVRGEIEQMEAERKSMVNQVSYATLNLKISEDYKAQLQVVPLSTFTRLSNAAVDGYSALVESLLSVALLLLSAGPSLIFWGALLCLAAWLIWRRVRGAGSIPSP